VTQLNVEVESKRLELLHELLPNANALAYLYNPTDPGIAEPQMREVRSAAQAFGIKLTVLNLRIALLAKVVDDKRFVIGQ
jgi:putative tryptophan/tyrosine transport system substrate-binding protein